MMKALNEYMQNMRKPVGAEPLLFPCGRYRSLRGVCGKVASEELAQRESREIHNYCRTWLWTSIS